MTQPFKPVSLLEFEFANANREEHFMRQIGMFRKMRDILEHHGLAPQVRVIGSHNSGSNTLPVMEYHILANGLRIVMRDNFHDVKVSVESPVTIQDKNFDKYIDIYKTHAAVYCEGFPTSRVFGSYAANPRRFTVSINPEEHYQNLEGFIAAVATSQKRAIHPGRCPQGGAQGLA